MVVLQELSESSSWQGKSVESTTGNRGRLQGWKQLQKGIPIPSPSFRAEAEMSTLLAMKPWRLARVSSLGREEERLCQSLTCQASAESISSES